MPTGRRSFLAAALAWLAAVVALVWPRRALSSPRRGFTPPTAPAVPAALPYRSPAEPQGDVRLYGDAVQMFEEMHAHLCVTGHAVLPCDDPERLRIGFSTFDDSGGPERAVWWQCSFGGLRSLASRLQDEGDSAVPRSFGTSEGKDAAGILLECFKSSEGKARLARAYQEAGRERFRAGLGPFPAT